MVKDLKDGQWTIENIEEKLKTLTLNRHLQLLLFSKRLQEKLRFSARKTMRTAQTLYEQGFITYMRTDSTALSDEGMAASRLQIEKVFGKEYLPEKGNFTQQKLKMLKKLTKQFGPLKHKISFFR